MACGYCVIFNVFSESQPNVEAPMNFKEYLLKLSVVLTYSIFVDLTIRNNFFDFEFLKEWIRLYKLNKFQDAILFCLRENLH